MRLPLALCALSSLMLCTAAVAQTGSDFYAYPRAFSSFDNLKRNPRELTFSRLPGVSGDYRIGPGDQLAIEVVNLPEMSLNLEVSNSGVINMPLVGQFRAADLTAAELEAELAEVLRKKDLVRNPEVLVDVVEYVAKPIFILGEVDKAGEYIMSQQLTLMDAILIAGGLDITAGRHGYLHRRLAYEEDGASAASVSPGDQRTKPLFNTLRSGNRLVPALVENPERAAPGTEVIRVDLAPLKRGGLLSENILLRKGDVFIVPRVNPEVMYVIGDVRRPGAHEMRPEEALMVTQAIAASGGPSQTAKTKNGVLVRHDADGNRVQRKVDFSAILRGAQPDFKVLPNDIVFIPGSKYRTLAYGLLGVVPQTVQQAVPPLPAMR